MTQAIELVAEARENVGKGSAREERRKERIPAVIYGGKAAPAPISVTLKDIMNYVNNRSFYISLFDIKINGKSNIVLPRDAQFHPVTDRPLHVDFLRVTKTTKIKVNIPLNFTDIEKSPGLKRGGTLNVVSQQVEVLCSAMNIPDKFDLSLDGFALGQPIHLGDIDLPKGVSLTTKDLGMTIASIAVPSALRSKARTEDSTLADSAEEGAEAKTEGEEKPAEKDSK